ncbi:hypothetical protein JCM10908_004477 [Rhodotorula pacifica]|uniref:uncharacterized protein n=1 Tax=Rhodotorula pacifica TaxID=1495444 RepID=UPI00317DC745
MGPHGFNRLNATRWPTNSAKNALVASVNGVMGPNEHNPKGFLLIDDLRWGRNEAELAPPQYVEWACRIEVTRPQISFQESAPPVQLAQTAMILHYSLAWPPRDLTAALETRIAFVPSARAPQLPPLRALLPPFSRISSAALQDDRRPFQQDDSYPHILPQPVATAASTSASHSESQALPLPRNFLHGL